MQQNKPPSPLVELQRWFQSVITLPIDYNGSMQTKRLILEEAQQYIRPNDQLTSRDRIQIYHEQYWWRLLAHLHKMFPTLLRLFGPRDFNMLLGIPYLTKYPSRHWSLSKLADRMPDWIEGEYLENDKSLIFFSALLDLAYDKVFLASTPVFFPFSTHSLTEKINLQSHVKLLELPFDLLTFRLELLKKPFDFWLENDFPKLVKGKKQFILYRTKQQEILYEELEEGQWMLLHLIDGGFNINQACDTLEFQGGKPYEEAKNGLSNWIQGWIQKNWLLPTPSHSI